MSKQATEIDLRWRMGVLAGGLCTALALAGCTAPPDALAPDSAVQTPATTTTSAAALDSTTTLTVAPDSTTTSAAAPGPTTTSAAAPGPTTTSAAALDSTTTSAAAPDPTTTLTVAPDSTTTSAAAPDSTTTSTTTGQGSGPVSGGEGSATKDEGAETGLGETGGKPGEPGEPAPSVRGAGTADLGPVEGRVYEWLDGDRTRRVWMQTDLVLEERGQAPDDQVVLRFGGDQDIVNREGRHDGVETQPVFRSESGDVMTLPGGVLVVLDPTWGHQAVQAFFGAHGIPETRVEDQAFAANAFLVDTPPGLPSLELANRLAGEDGVVVSSPNWATAVFPR